MRTTLIGNVAWLGVGITGANLVTSLTLGQGPLLMFQAGALVVFGLVAVKEMRR
ncbi:MAG: hypothetical protein AB1592_11405 [Pseudomonadota bacterium]